MNGIDLTELIAAKSNRTLKKGCFAKVSMTIRPIGASIELGQ